MKNHSAFIQRVNSFVNNQWYRIPVKSYVLLGSLFFAGMNAMAHITETEPNDLISTANYIGHDTAMNATICPPGVAGDIDFFLMILPADGILKVNTAVTQDTVTGSLIGLNFGIFNKMGGYLNGYTVASGTSGVFAADSFFFSCASSDTLYLRVYASSLTNDCHTYSFSYTVIPAVYANDPEPNDNIAQATPLPYNTPLEGHLAFLYNSTDDYYRLIVPNDGILRIRTRAESEQATTQTINVGLFEKTGGYITGWNVNVGANDTVVNDTILYGCFSADTFYVRLYSSGCGFSYWIYYNIIPAVFANDVEPNDNISQATLLPYNTPREGHLNFALNNTDDYYRIILPDDGPLRIFTSAESEQPVAQNLNLELYNKTGSSIHSWTLTAGANRIPFADSSYFSCLAADTFYIRLSTANCGLSYRIRFNSIVPRFANDTEPNDDLNHAFFFAANTAQTGHLGFYGMGGYDCYKLFKPDTGNLKLFMQVSHPESDISILQISYYNSTQVLLGNVSGNVGVNGQIAYDTIIIPATVPDTFYVQLSFYNGICGSYSMQYPALITGIHQHADIEAALIVLPNPSSGIFNFAFKSIPPEAITVYNAEGRPMFFQTIDRSMTVFQLNAGNFKPGFYFAKISYVDGRTDFVKLVVVH
jgi:hypothetical protein